MKSLFVKIALGVIVVTLYIASPFVSAWFIREAVHNGNSDYLAYAVEWPSVRETLKPSIARIALNLPDPDQDPAASSGFWQRLKTTVGQSVVDRIVDTYVTPQGLPQLFTLGKNYRDLTSNDAAEAKATPPLFERIERAWERVKRAEFTGFTTFEIDMADKHDPARIYLGKLKLTPVGWKLAELRIKFLTTAKNTIEKTPDTEGDAL
jgi:hypothetical protein